MCASRVMEKNRDSGQTLRLQRPRSQSRRLSLSALDQLSVLLDELSRVMESTGYGVGDCYAVRLALDEAVVNAVKHGHGHDPRKQVQIWWVVTTSQVKMVVKDEGPGFDPTRIPDPCLPENLDRPCGRGLWLIHAYMNWVQYNRRGNCLAMCRRRSLPEASRG